MRPVTDFAINLALWMNYTRRLSLCGYDGKHVCKWRATRDGRALVCLVSIAKTNEELARAAALERATRNAVELGGSVIDRATA